MKIQIFFAIACLCTCLAQEARLLRFPTIHNDQVVFTYAGDLYTASAQGGVARKLTNDIGYEMFAHFSPDGQWIAFTGQYDGNTEVYVMQAQGGIPKRLTYTATLDRDDVSDRMGPNNIVMGWRDNDTIIYRSRGREWNAFKGQLYLVAREGGLSEQLPLPRGGFCSYSPDKGKLAYNRVFREFRTWKRYRGGQADDICVYDFLTKKTLNITNHPSQDIFPMWYENKIYFLSDREQRMNLFVYDLDTQKIEQLTQFAEFDIKFPCLGNTAIVFENGGYLYRYDFANAKAEKISILIQEDFDIARPGLIDVSKTINSADISPDGKRVVLGSRGEIFTVPAKYGVIRNLTNSSGIHERCAVWSPDGQWIAFISDASGETEIYLMPQAGGQPVQLTTNADTYKYRLEWSPDSKKLLWNDKLQRLLYVDIETKKTTMIAQATAWEIRSFQWSPDSKWVCYDKIEEKQMTTLYLYSIAENRSWPISDGWYDSYQPVFSDNGQYLFFVSARTFEPIYGMTEWNHVYADMEKLYLITLTPDVPSPFAPKSDEVSIATPEPPKKDKPEAKQPEKENQAPKENSGIQIVLAGIMDRVLEIPVPVGQYSNLTVAGSKLYYMRSHSSAEQWMLCSYDLEKCSEAELGEVHYFVISADKKKMLVYFNNTFAILDMPVQKVDLRDKLVLSDMKVLVNRSEEWKQIFMESWRQMRDFLYAPNMHGVDWPKMRDTYSQLLPYVRHRCDLTYVIGEMIGELNIGHAYVGGGDFPRPERIKVGLLGAQLQQDAESKYYRITKILKGQTWDPSLRSPFQDIGVKAKEGDFILAINGQPTNTMSDIYAALVGTAGKQVKLTLNTTPQIQGSWETTVIPIADEQNLYYFNWIQANILRVNQATDGKVGYIHIPDMGVRGLNQFAKYFYPQMKKKGLIIDVRGNGGGNVSPMIIERLRRELAMIDIARNTSQSYNPGEMHYGPKVCLMDEFSASDGDIFPYRFRHHKLGKLIGKRSWGGVVGIRESLPFLDNGYLNRPEFSRYDITGKTWVMEGYGVDPDIVIDNDPAWEYQGYDQQLETAIQEITKLLQETSYELPPPPPYPDKSK